MVPSLSLAAVAAAALWLAVPGFGLMFLICGARTSLPARVALVLPLGYATVTLCTFPLVLVHAFFLPAIAVVWVAASLAIWVFAIKRGRIRAHGVTARASLVSSPWRLAAALLVFGWYSVIRWSYQPLVNLAAAPLRYWADGVEIADAHGIPSATLQYNRLLVPTVSKIFFNVFQGGVALILGRTPLEPMGALLFVVSIGLALLVFALAADLGLRYTAPLVVLVVVASPRIPMNFASDLVAARAENWGRLAALGALLLIFRVLKLEPGLPRRKALVAAGALLGVAAATHLIAAAAVVALSIAYWIARAIVDRSGKRDLRPLAGVAVVALAIVSMAFLLSGGDLGFQAASGDASYAQVRTSLGLPAGFDPSVFIVTDGRPEQLAGIGSGPAHFFSWLSSVMQGRDPIADPASPAFLAFPALAAALAAAVLLRRGNRRLRRVALMSIAFATIILATGIGFALRYHMFALSNFGNRRLIDYLALPAVMLAAGLLELFASIFERKPGHVRSTGAISFALVFVMCLAILPGAEALPAPNVSADAMVLQWMAQNVPCEGRILADRRTVATFQAMTGHAGVVEGMGPHLRPDVLTYAIGNILGAQEFFRHPSLEYLQANGVAAVVVTTAAPDAIGGWNRFSDVDPATLEKLPYLVEAYHGPTATVFTVTGFEPNPNLPSVADAPGYSCPSAASGNPPAPATSGLNSAALPYRGTTLVSEPRGPGAHLPLLADLQVSGAGIQLRPTFNPRIFRYAIYRAGRSDSFTITAEPAQAGDRLTTNGREVKAGIPVELQFGSGNNDVHLAVSKGSEHTTYQLVELPTGFPVINVSIADPAKVAPGPLYLAVNSDPHSCIPPQACWVMTVDAYGVPIFYKRETRWVSDFKLQPNSQRTYTVILGTKDPPYAAAVVLGRGGTTRQLVARGFRRATNAHDFLMLPGGKRVFLAYAPGKDEAGGGSMVDVVEGVVQKQKGRRVVFRWNSAGAIPLSDSLRPPPDYLHLNSVAMGTNHDVLVSARGTSQIYDIDLKTGRINWRLGGTSSDFQFAGDPYGGFCGQHSAVPLPHDRVLLFDNGQSAAGWSTNPTRSPLCPPAVEASSRGLVSRAVEYALNPADGVATMIWSYDQGTYSPSQGSVQRLANGNTLVGWGINDAGLLATEVTPDGRKVFEISGAWPDGTAVFSYRALRFPR